MLDQIKDYYVSAINGHVNELEAYVYLDRVIKLSKKLQSDLKDAALDEAAKQDKTFKMNGSEITLKSSAGRWDFKHIDEWKEAHRILKLKEQSYKEAYKLKQKGQTLLEEGTGEVVPTANYTPGADTLSIKHNLDV